MGRFLDCLCDENYLSLIISGRASAEELKQTWLLLLYEFYEMRGERISGAEMLHRDILRLQHHLSLLEACIRYLEVRYSDAMADAIRKLGYPFLPADKEPEAYKPLLNSIVAQSKNKYIKLKQLFKEFDKQMADAVDKKPKRDDFEGMLIAFEEMQKVSYTMDLITVAKYLTLEKKYNKLAELMEAKLQRQ